MSRLTSSWWKAGVCSSRTQRSASPSSPLEKSSRTISLTATLRSSTPPTAAPRAARPHTLRRRPLKCAAASCARACESVSRIRSETSASGGSCLTKAGGSTSSATARTRKAASRAGVAGMSSVRPSAWERSTSKPRARARCSSGAWASAQSRREISSRCWSVRSRASSTATRTTLCCSSAGKLISPSRRRTSATSCEHRYSSTTDPTSRRNAATSPGDVSAPPR
mmetsp:Transcript_3314/g.10305  ORF Transcript_3314/g.10305 Transcript_3314/m.10305 type:complete len:224 (+) Transcript_3314:587-1258(+)